MTLFYRRKNNNGHTLLPFSQASDEIKACGCDGICAGLVERKIGPKGPFFFCSKCAAVIPEGEDGAPAKPIGICPVCRSYVYRGVRADGVIWDACSQYNRKHTKK